MMLVLGDLVAGQPGRRPRRPAARAPGRTPPTSSSSSEEISTTPRPVCGQLVDQRLHLGLGADVDAAGRLVEQQHLRVQAQQPGEEHLLLVAAGQLADLLVRARRLDPQPLHEVVDDRVDLAVGDETRAREPGQCGERDVLPDREVRARCPRPCGPRAAGRARRRGPRAGSSPADRRAADGHLARVERLGTEDRLDRLAAPRAEQARRGRRPRPAGRRSRHASSRCLRVSDRADSTGSAACAWLAAKRSGRTRARRRRRGRASRRRAAAWSGPATGPSWTRRPSRSTVTPSQIAKISSSLWLT